MLNWGENADLRTQLEPKIRNLLDALQALKKFYSDVIHLSDPETDAYRTRVYHAIGHEIIDETIAEEIVASCKKGIEVHRYQEVRWPVNQCYLIVIELIIFYMKCLSGYHKGPMNETGV